jgi:hypothetical protein
MDKFESEVYPATAHEIDGDDVVQVPAIEMRHTHNGYQWTCIKMTSDEWQQVIKQLQAEIESH